MRPYEKPRNPASEALIELRQFLGMSQAEFAVKVLEMAPMTVSRMETTTPPRGELLLKLAEIASSEAEKFDEVDHNVLNFMARRFRALFTEELVSAAPSSLITYKDYGYLVMKIEGQHGLRAASSFLSLIPSLHSKNEHTRKTAIAIADDLISAVDKLDGNPLMKNLQDILHPRATEEQKIREASKGKKWQSTDAVKRGGSSSNSAGSKSASRRTPGAGRPR